MRNSSKKSGKSRFSAEKTIRLSVTAAAFATLFFAAAYFEYLYVNGFTASAVYKRRHLIFAVSLILTVFLTVAAFTVAIKNDGFVYKICLTAIALLTVLTAVLYIGQKSGISKILRDVTVLRRKIEEFGAFAVPAFIILQALQVTALPLPGLITTAAGVAMFGCFRGGLYSFIGVTLGSFTAFFIGRKLGVRAAGALCGKKELSALLKKIKGKDKIVLTAAFFLPFFPDDLLCFAAGLSSMSGKYFCSVITLSRCVSTFLTAYSLGGKLLPYDTWWGVVSWLLIIIGAFFAVKKIYQKGEYLQARFSRRKVLWKSSKNRTKTIKKSPKAKLSIGKKNRA